MAELDPRAAGAKRLRDKVCGHWGRPGHRPRHSHIGSRRSWPPDLGWWPKRLTQKSPRHTARTWVRTSGTRRPLSVPRGL